MKINPFEVALIFREFWMDMDRWIACKRCDSRNAPRLVFRMHKTCSSEEEEAELATRDVAEIPIELMKFPIDFPLEVLTEPEKCCLEDDLSIVIYSIYIVYI